MNGVFCCCYWNSDYCEEGGAFSRITQGVSSMSNAVLDLFTGKDRKLAERAKNNVPDDLADHELLSEEKLSEIEEKYKDKMKDEI